jgi:prophage tail gpP-like protein
MADDLIATIVANGQAYPGWTSIEIWREYGQPVSYMKFSAAEDTSAAYYSVQPGDLAQGYLQGIQCINGQVITRQVSVDKGNHVVEVIVASQTQGLVVGTVKNNPGQYKNQTFQQIASAAAGVVGVNLKILGNPSGADIPFARVSEHIGEQVIDFIRRLAMWRNLHLGDDSQGNLIAMRADSSAPGASVAQLTEGVNCEIGHLIENIQSMPDKIGLTTQQPGNDQSFGADASQVFVSTTVPGYKGPPRPVLFLGEQPGTKQEAQLRLNHAVNLLNLQMLEASVFVPGWLQDNGQLWISLVGNVTAQPITLNMPSFWPQNPVQTLYIKGVKHTQDDTNGTRTEVICTIPNGLGGFNPIGGGLTSIDVPSTPSGSGGIGHA